MIAFPSLRITALFGRVSVVVLTLLALIWMALIFDFADIVGHLSAVLNHLDGGQQYSLRNEKPPAVPVAGKRTGCVIFLRVEAFYHLIQGPHADRLFQHKA